MLKGEPKLALTFDDVLLIPGASAVMPSEVDLKSKFTTDITLNIPVASAAMDTVTEADTAISVAREGGIGVLHRSMSPEDQASEVEKVKRAQSAMIRNPVVAAPTMKVGEAIRMASEKNITGIPVLDQDKKVLGIVTNRDLRFQQDLNQTIGDIMTKDVITISEKTSAQ